MLSISKDTLYCHYHRSTRVIVRNNCRWEKSGINWNTKWLPQLTALWISANHFGLLSPWRTSFSFSFADISYSLTRCKLPFLIKVNKSRYIALFVVSGSVQKLFSIDCVNIYFSKSISPIFIFPQYFFQQVSKVRGYPTLPILWFFNSKTIYFLLSSLMNMR